MAAHARQQIRIAALALLTGLSTTGANAFASRTFPLNDSTLPGLIVYTKRESKQDASIGIPRLQRRSLYLVIEGYAKTATALDDTLDAIAKEVELALAAVGGAFLQGKATDCVLEETDFELKDGDKNLGVVTLHYLVTFRTKEGVPDAIVQ